MVRDAYIMKNFDQFRQKRQEAYNFLFSAGALCFTGLLAMPAMLFNASTPLRAAQFIFFWFLCWLSGRKNNPLMTILIILGIIAVNLIIPYGRVLFSIGMFRITGGALKSGIERAVTLEGLIMLSRLAVRQDLKLPGSFGELLSESFRFFALITDSGKRVTGKNFIGDIDNLMLDLSNGEHGDCVKAELQITKTKPAGFIILSAALAVSWFLFFAGKSIF